MNTADPNLSLAERLDAVCDRFEARWIAGERLDIAQLVAAAPEADRIALREALIAIEFELQGRSIADTSANCSSVQTTGVETTAVQFDSSNLQAAIGRFQIRQILGTGAFGKVYRAFDPQLGREVAIKVPISATIQTEGDRLRFLKEARAAATINHPNICQIHEVGEVAGRPYIVMAIVPGQSLAAAIKSRKEPMAERQACLIVRKIALALAAAHEKGVVHRDLKPANVMYDRQRKDIVVMDFGLARGPQLGNSQATQSGVIMGTPAYMSPEQARGGSKQVGPAGDVYSLGVVFYEMLTGQRPFNGTTTEVLGQILHVQPEPPSKHRPALDPRLEAVCLKALAKDPAERFASMKEFATAIDAIVRTAPSSPATETARTRETRDDSSEQSSNTNLAEVFAALADDQKQRAEAAVAAAIAKHSIPRWMFVLIGVLLVGGMAGLAGIFFFTRSDKVQVDLAVIINDVDLKDKTLSFFLNEESITADALATPVELKPGVHVFAVKRGKDILKRLVIRVAGGSDASIKVEDITPKKSPPPILPEAEPVKPAEPMVDHDRVAAEFVLSIGGKVQVDFDERKTITQPWQLPTERFKLTMINVEQNRQLKNSDLAIFKDLEHVRWLVLNETNITDAGLAHFKNYQNLTTLYCARMQITDDGLANFKQCADIRWLHFYDTNATDKGLALFTDCENLETLWIGGTAVTDDGLKPLTKCKFLKWLDIRNLRNVKNAGYRLMKEAHPLCRIDIDPQKR